MTTALPETATLREFAVIGGFKPSYAHQLKRDDRLVLAADGKHVRVAESLARIRDTRDPSKAGVTARHAAERAPDSPPAHEQPAPETDNTDPANDSGYQSSRALKERYLAMSAKRDYEISIGKLMDAAQVEAATADAITILRTRLETLPDTLGPQLAAITDEAQCRATLAETIEHTLTELARQFQQIGKQHSA